MVERPAGLQHRPRAIEVDPVTQVEIRLGAGAQHRGQVEHAVGRGVDRAPDQRRIGDVAGHLDHARVVEAVRAAVAVHELGAVEQALGEFAPQKPGGPGDHHLHAAIP
jgi:hypothetical protein